MPMVLATADTPDQAGARLIRVGMRNAQVEIRDIR